MKPSAAKTQFTKRLEAAKLTQTLSVSTGTEAMLTFYTDERADGCDFDEDG